MSTLALATLMLTACGASSNGAASDEAAAPTVSVEPASPSSASSTPSSSPSPTRNENARGELIKEIGEAGGWKMSEGEPNVITFKVTAIEPITCDAPYAAEPNGIALAVSLEIETTADFEGPLEVNGAPGQISFGPYYWKGYADNGTRMNTVESNISQSCVADQSMLLPGFIGKGEKLNGKIILDVTSPAGSIAFYPDAGQGWIWEYPSS